MHSIYDSVRYEPVRYKEVIAKMVVCELCEREVTFVTKHHLVPRQKGGVGLETVDLCGPCHKTIHAFVTNTELVQRYSTIDKLKEAEELQGYLKRIRKRGLERLPIWRRKR